MVGQTVSHYRITGKLGEGGMGVVYKAQDTRLDRPVALKFLAPHLLRDEESRKRFEREAKAAAKLDHPNICTVYEIDEAGGRTFIAMAFLEGRPLSRRIEEGPLPLTEAISIATQIAEGLEAAHEKGITHRDIKPDNVMLMSGSRGLVKLMDFGLAQLAGGSKFTREGETLGTVRYMSPQQIEGSPTDRRTDVWSLGVVFYEMLCGQVPFRGEYDQAIIYAIANEPPQPLTALRTGIPIELDWIIEKALAKSPARRHQGMAELIVDLGSVQRKLMSEEHTKGRSIPAAGATVAVTGLETARLSALSRTAPQPGGHSHTLQRRRMRDHLLDLAGQGLLPDSVLAEALDLIVREQHVTGEARQRRRLLLDDLLYQRVRVGEFIDEWHRLGKTVTSEGAEGTDSATRSLTKGREYRTNLQLLGLPLIHIATGVEPETGEPRVAKGCFALGRIAVGVVALGSRFAAGLMAVGPVSVGMLSLGVAAIGGETVGLIRLGMPWNALWGLLCLIFVVFPAWRYARARSFLSNVDPDAGGTIEGWAVLKKRAWHNDSPCFHGGSVVAVCGNYDIDLSATEAITGRAILDASVVCGSIRVRVPSTWSVKMEGNTIAGDYTVRTNEPWGQSDPVASELLLTGFALFGAVTLQRS